MVEHKKYEGSATRAFSIQINPTYVESLETQLQQANKDKAELVKALLEAADVCETWIASDYSPHKKYRAIAAKHKEDV